MGQSMLIKAIFFTAVIKRGAWYRARVIAAVPIGLGSYKAMRKFLTVMSMRVTLTMIS